MFEVGGLVDAVAVDVEVVDEVGEVDVVEVVRSRSAAL